MDAIIGFKVNESVNWGHPGHKLAHSIECFEEHWPKKCDNGNGVQKNNPKTLMGNPCAKFFFKYLLTTLHFIATIVNQPFQFLLNC